MISRCPVAGLIRPAETEDVSALLWLRAEASAWLQTLGLDQWSADQSEQIERNVAAGVAWVVEVASVVVATLTLHGPDRDFWTEADEPGTGLHVYKMMCARMAAGRDLGGAMLNWAADRAARQGYRWLRLDCWRTNAALHRYYERQGFTHLRTVTVAGRQSGALFQRRAQLDPAPRLTEAAFGERRP